MKKIIIILYMALVTACAPSGQNQDEQAEFSAPSVPVYIKSMKPEKFEHYIRVNGSVEADQDAMISPEINGQIRTIHVKEGQSVKKDQLLVSLNTSVTESSIEEVKTGWELAEKLYNKQKELWDQNIGSEIQYLEAKNAKESAENRLKTLQAQLEMARVKAPFNGLVEEIFSKVGELASPGMRLCHVVNLSKIMVTADVSEIYLPSLEVGDKVHLEFPSYPDLEIQVPITRIGNVINPQSRTFKIEMKLDNPENLLKPNILAWVKLNDFYSDAALVVPAIIIKKDMNGNYLYVAQHQSSETFVAQKTYVEPGATYEELTLIVSGLNQGDKVIITGYDQVNNGIPVDIK